MDIIIEEILGLVLEESIEATKSSKIPKVVRIILASILILFFTFIIGAVLLAGILSIKDNLAVGLLFIGIGIFLLVSAILKVKNTYNEIKNRK